MAFQGVCADDVTAPGGTSLVKDTTCESRLETTKSELQKAQQAVHDKKMKEVQAAPLAKNQDWPLVQVLLATPGAFHWPASRAEYVPPLVEYFYDGLVWLKSTNQQFAVSAVMGACGILNMVSGPSSFKTVLVVGLALIAAASAQYEVTLVWPAIGKVQQIFVSAEVGLLTAFVVYKSIKGATIIVGVLFGFGISCFLEKYFHTEIWSLNVSLGWYAAWVFVGVVSLTYFQRRTLAILIPTLGGFLLSSSMGYFVMLAAWGAKQQPHNSVPDWLNIQGDTWLDFAQALLGSHVPAGIFGTMSTPGFMTGSIQPDRVMGRFLWFYFFYLGMKWQLHRAKSQRQLVQDNNSAYYQSLKEPLVQEASSSAWFSKKEAV